MSEGVRNVGICGCTCMYGSGLSQCIDGRVRKYSNAG